MVVSRLISRKENHFRKMVLREVLLSKTKWYGHIGKSAQKRGRTMRKQIGRVGTVLLVLAMLTGCGAVTKESYDSAPMENGATASGSYWKDDGYTKVETEESVEMEMDSYFSGATDFLEDSDSITDTTNSSQTGSTDDTEIMTQQTARKLIRTVNMDLETLEFDSFMQFVEQRVKEYDGYVESSQINGNRYYYDNNRYANLTIRIPEAKLDSFLELLGESATVTYKYEQAEDITLQYVDTQSRIKTLQVEQEKLFELLEKADTLDAIIMLENRMSEVRYQLENYTARLRVYDNQVSYSTIHLSISEVKRITATQEETFAEKLKNGFMDSLYDIEDGFLDFVIWLVSNSIYLVFWAVVFIVAGLVIRKKVQKKRLMKQLKEIGKENGTMDDKE